MASKRTTNADKAAACGYRGITADTDGRWRVRVNWNRTRIYVVSIDV
jgi:hypothetical protein